ncbi:hypothetical protein MASR1M68_16560 [Elusimicrobiota bacterium]
MIRGNKNVIALSICFFVIGSFKIYINKIYTGINIREVSFVNRASPKNIEKKNKLIFELFFK